VKFLKIILPAALGPGVYLASNGNDYRKHKKKKEYFWGVKCGWCVGLTTLPPSMSRLSRQCGTLNISQLFRSSRPVTENSLIFFLILRYSNEQMEGGLETPTLLDLLERTILSK
jgi:hypothetical protein